MPETSQMSHVSEGLFTQTSCGFKAPISFIEDIQREHVGNLIALCNNHGSGTMMKNGQFWKICSNFSSFRIFPHTLLFHFHDYQGAIGVLP